MKINVISALVNLYVSYHYCVMCAVVHSTLIKHTAKSFKSVTISHLLKYLDHLEISASASPHWHWHRH